MKNVKVKIISLISTIMIMSAMFTLSSCGTAASTDISSAEINSGGELIITYTDGTVKNLGTVSLGGSTTVVIDGGDGDVSAAASIGLTSAVSISARFTKTVKNPYIGIYPGLGNGTSTEYAAAGSGVIYQLDGDKGSAFIITNYHVVYDNASDTGISNNISVFLYGRESEDYAIPASYVGGSPYYDIAVLRVDKADALRGSVYRQITPADADSISPGDKAIAVGNPESYGISVSQGIVSVTSEYITMTAADGVSRVTQRVMRVDTAVNSGNSGGGLYNDMGQLIGIVNAKIVDNSVENIGYAIPAEVALNVADNIIDNCYGKENKTVMRASLGVTLTAPDSRAVINTADGQISVVETVAVHSVESGSAAEGVLSAGDVFISASIKNETVSVTRRHKLIDLMLTARIGDTVTLTVKRGTQVRTVSITVTEGMVSAY